jgi:TonB family protein
MRRVGSTGLQGFFAALIIHALGIGSLFVLSPPERSKAAVRSPVKIRVAKRSQPVTPPVEVPEPLEVKKPEVKKPIVVEPKKPLRKKVATKKKPASAKKVAALEKTPIVEPATLPEQVPTERKTTPRKFTVSMEATVSGGGVAVPVSSSGGWTFGAPDGSPEGEKTLAGPAPEPVEKKAPPEVRQASGVTRLPKLISQPSSLDMRAAYPEAKRREGLEANVYLKILVNSAGKVDQVRVVRSAGQAFDQAAISLVKKFRFRPSEADGKPVSVWIPWTYKFRLEG